VTLRFVEHPPYAHAHPGEPCEPNERCTECCIAVRPDTGARVLLWRAGGRDWTLSRNDPAFAEHQDLRQRYLEVAA
jgi:hypothetical protein